MRLLPSLTSLQLHSLPTDIQLIDRDKPFDKGAGTFNPNGAIAQTIVNYVGSLIAHIDEYITAKPFSGDSKRPWRKLNQASYHTQWSYWYDTANQQARYGIRASTNKGEFEKLLAYRHSDQSLEIDWTINGFMPGTVHLSKAANEAVPSIKFIDYPIVPFRTLVSMLLGQEGFTQRPEVWQQRVFHILVSEAKWLDKLVAGKIWTNGETKQFGTYKVTYSSNNGTRVSTIQSKTSSMTVTYENEQIKKITRESKNPANKYRIEIYPFSGSEFEDRASLLLINNKKENEELVTKTLELEQQLALLRLLANGNVELNQRVVDTESQLQDLKQRSYCPIAEDSTIKHYELGYSLGDIRSIQAHRKCLLGADNLAVIMTKTGLLYNSGAQTDFLKDIKLPAGAVLLPWPGSVNDCWLTNINGEPIELSRFGDRRLRRRSISTEQEEPAIYNITQFAAYLKTLGVNLITDPSFANAVYRWGIKSSSGELATKGIFYIAPETLYLVDLGAKQSWSSLDVKKMFGNQIITQKLQSYPHKEFLRQALGREMKKGDGVSSEADLAKVLQAMDFRVPDIIETERFLLDKLHNGKKDDPVIQFLERRVKEAELNHASKAKYRAALGQRVAMRLLADRGCTNIRFIYRLKPESQAKAPGMPHIAYNYQGRNFLAAVDISGQLLDIKRDNLRQHIKEFLIPPNSLHK